MLGNIYQYTWNFTETPYFQHPNATSYITLRDGYMSYQQRMYDILTTNYSKIVTILFNHEVFRIIRNKNSKYYQIYANLNDSSSIIAFKCKFLLLTTSKYSLNHLLNGFIEYKYIKNKKNKQYFENKKHIRYLLDSNYLNSASKINFIYNNQSLIINNFSRYLQSQSDLEIGQILFTKNWYNDSFFALHIYTQESKTKVWHDLQNLGTKG